MTIGTKWIARGSTCPVAIALAAIGVCGFVPAAQAADEAVPAPTARTFDGPKGNFHGFDLYNFFIDERTLEIRQAPAGAQGGGAGRQLCRLVIPNSPAPGNPWSWRGCYWDHQPQTEVELLRRGFHIAWTGANPTTQHACWDAWYALLTEKHGLSKKPCFIGMSRGGEFEFTWATQRPDQVSCIYADNMGANAGVFERLPALVRNDVPVIQVCGSIDPLLGRNALVVESMYYEFGGRMTMLIKDGAGHHPHSLADPKFLADFIEKSVKEVAPTTPAFVPGRATRTTFYAVENSYREFPKERDRITCRGAAFAECYDRYAFSLPCVEGAVNVIVPNTPALGNPWVFRAEFVGRDAAVDLALLAKGFHIVTGPVPCNADGPIRAHWDAVYRHLTSHGFSAKPVMEGAGRAAGEVYVWAIANPDKVACIYAENPILRSSMSKTQPLENLAPLVRADVPVLHVCGSLDPSLESQTRVAEKRYKELGGRITVIVKEGEGHYPLAPQAPKPVVDFITASTQGSKARSTAPPPPPPGGSGKYFRLDYPGSAELGELQTPVSYLLWIPDGVTQLRGLIVHQHGAVTTASIEGSTGAYDLHWQALAKKSDCALWSSSYHVANEKVDLTPGGSEHWFDPRRGSEKRFLQAMDEFAARSGHAELAKVPWVLWGHSGGGIWSDVMTTLHPERVVAVWLRSGSAAMFRSRREFPQPQIPAGAYAVPAMCNPGAKEPGPYQGTLATFKEYRLKGAPIGFAPAPRTGHECGDSRYLAIPFLDACLAMRLPDKGSKDQTLKPVDMSNGWLASLVEKNPQGAAAMPATEYKGNPNEAVWLPNEAVAKAWVEYVKTGAVSDTTPPPAPFDVRVAPLGDKGIEVLWNAEADFESGIRNFIVLRDGKELASVPEKPIGRFGRPLFQSVTYHDTPNQPLPKMRYIDGSARVGEKHAYRVITVNSVGLQSQPSAAASLL